MKKPRPRPTSAEMARKRRKVLWKIASVAGANVVFAGAPKPAVEVPTHIALTAADFIMCGLIYEEYYDDTISEQGVLDALGEAGLLLVLVGGGGYALAKGASGLFAEFTNFLGPLGWMASGLLAAGGTATLGLIWMAIVDHSYQNRRTLAEAAKSIFT